MSTERTKKKPPVGNKRLENNFTITVIVAVVMVVVLLLGYEVMVQNEKDANIQLVTDSSLTIKDGDKVNIDFVSYIDGVEYDGATTGGQGADLTIGSKTLEGMEEQLIGAHPGDTVEMYITFAEDYKNNKTLAGNEVLFVVTVNGIYQEIAEAE